MSDIRTILFYGAGLVILVAVTFFFSRRIEPLEAEPPPIKTATAMAAVPTPTLTPTATPEVDCRPTPRSWDFGYLSDAPETTNLAPSGSLAEPLIIFGTVYASDCETPLPEVLVEVWQADENGLYDRKPPLTFRAQMRTDPAGRYAFSTIMPGHYKVNRELRPAHIHYRLSYNGTVFATRLLFAGDPYLATGNLAPEQANTIQLVERFNIQGPYLRGQFDIVMPVTPPSPTPSATPTAN